MAATTHRASMPLLQQTPFTCSKPQASECTLSFQVTSKWNIQSYLRIKRQSQAERDVTQAEAVWFLSLPDKIRRQQFSQEEQILIRAKSELALLHASPEIRDHFDDARSTYSRKKSLAYESKSRRSSIPSVPSIASSSAFSSPARESFESQDDARSINATVHDSVMATTAPQHSTQTFLRSPTITNQAFERPLTARSTGSSSRPASFRRTMQGSQRALPPPPISISKPLYYRTPEAKALLRDALATPERFDETLNFGFRKDSMVKTPGVDGMSPGAAIKSSWVESRIHRSHDSEAELSSADEVEDPPTPDFAPRVVRPKSGYFSIAPVHSAAPSPNIQRAASNTAYFEELMNRDMTLRMTLTKPELRASEEEIYGWQDNDKSAGIEDEDDEDEEADPLALQELTYSDDVTGAFGAFAQAISKKKGIKALWFKK